METIKEIKKRPIPKPFECFCKECKREITKRTHNGQGSICYWCWEKKQYLNDCRRRNQKINPKKIGWYETIIKKEAEASYQ